MTGSTLTLEKLHAAMRAIEKMPPPPFFGSKAEFPSDRAIMFRHDRREYVLAGPGFWDRVRHACREKPAKLGELDLASLYRLNMGGIPIIDLDVPERRELLLEVVGFMAEALNGAPLPDPLDLAAWSKL